MSEKVPQGGLIFAFKVLVVGGLAVAIGVTVLFPAEEPKTKDSLVQPEPVFEPRIHPSLRKTVGARWVRDGQPGGVPEWVDVLVTGKQQEASRRCRQLIVWHDLNGDDTGGHLTHFCEEERPIWPPDSLGVSPNGWVLDLALEAEPVELALRQFEPRDSDFQREFKVLSGLVANRFNTEQDPLAGERWLLAAQVHRYQLFQDEPGCQDAVRAIPLAERLLLEKDLVRLELALADQRERVSAACPTERGRGDSVVRCEISRRTLAVLAAHLEKQKKGKLAGHRATCQPLGRQPD